MADKKKSGSNGAKKTKQIEMVDVARSPKDVQIRRLAKEYIDVRDARMALTPKEVAAKQKLMLAMQSKELKEYNDGEYAVTTEVVDSVKAKKLTEEDAAQTKIGG